MFGQLVRQIPYMMVIHQRNRADRLLLFRTEAFLHQRSPDQIADRFGAVDVVLLLDQLIKILQ